MHLEDEFGDIISKAWSGLNLSIQEVSEKTGISVDKLSKFEDYSLKPTENEVKKLSLTLKLNFKALLNIANNNYKPREFDYSKYYDGIKVIPVKALLSGYGVYAYILSLDDKCVIIDTAGSPELVINKIKEFNLNPLFVLLTHSHSDHIGGINKIKNEFNIDGYILKSKLFSSNNLKSLHDGQFIDFSGGKINVIHTPGHTQDSVTFSVGSFLFVGDLIFAGSLGRGNWSYKELIESARKILEFPADYHIFPGHGAKTTVVEEKVGNAFII